ncbi:Capsular polysaccharide type 8 biosynthesis protein cap8A [Pelotomaculum schinkii]|uniref:Capsular polysaccharide type 8 biosynthesis protein cap8A n=1 Tax=Pelotomaculum schinkii TaxID=78350 RepID=A0A4Y7RGU1_9FIRM|nr:Wzz/FepE/Etk N-terminal domain-containing protein [Pelotomaculum schinkii]TEB08228.1 Capsular polysaccharide type 8 biosynthesis protein cap8A [Pelotomaculum schinkii]
MPNQNTPAGIDGQEIDLRVYIQLLKKRRALVVLLPLLAALVSAILSFFVLKPVYEAKTVLLVTQAADKLQTTTRSNDPDDLLNTVSRIPVLTMNTYVGQVKSDELMRRVIEQMGLEPYGFTPRSLAQQVKASSAKDSYLLEVSVSNHDPQLAVDIANTLSKEFIGSITERNQEVMDRSVAFLQQQMEEVRKELDAATTQSERDRLQGMLTLLSEGITKTQITRSFDLGSTSVVIVSPAMAAVRVKPNKQMNIAVAFLLGLLAAVALAFALEFLDNTIKNPEDVARHLDLPVMGTIPSADSRARTYYGSD